MVSKSYVDKQLKKIDFKLQGWGRGEVAQLPHIILPDEEIYEVVNGIYEGGFALLIASDIRVLLVDKKPLSFLTVEDLRFDMINEIDYNHRLFGSSITVATGNKTLVFRSYNKARLRKLIGHVQHCMAETKKKQSSQVEGQSQHLEKINKQLQSYLKAQLKQQKKLQEHVAKLQAGMTGDGIPQMPEPVMPSRQLSDYLYSQGLIERYEQETGNKLTLPFPKAGLPQPVKTPQHVTNQLTDMYTAGMQEVFGRPTETSTSLEVNPLKVAYSKLPLLLRNRKFGLGNISMPTINRSSFRPPVAAKTNSEPEAA